ncbi:MAG: S8 family serine peptidase [Blastocatellia bacterium]
MTTSNDTHGRYLKLYEKEQPLLQHPTDFTVIGNAEDIKTEFPELHANVQQVAANISRVSVEDKDRDRLMMQVRQGKSQYVAHHVYKLPDSNDEVMIDDRIVLTLNPDSLDELEKIKDEYHLEDAGRMGDAYVLRVTAKTKLNPLKTANRIAKREGVESCEPHILITLQAINAPQPGSSASLFKKQWYLDSTQETLPDLEAAAGINLTEAWTNFGFGSQDVVIAVIDDGFDLGHQAFMGKDIDQNQKNFVQDNSDARSVERDIHGTPVASIATASRSGGAIIGVAPDCKMLPIRVNLGVASAIDPQKLLEIFEYASAHADVVNCSFGSHPTESNFLQKAFVKAITKLTVSGGRRKNGLVIVFGAGNDDAPTNLAGADNKNGVWFAFPVGAARVPIQIPPGKDVNTKFPIIPGVVVVGAVTSLKRKAGYSNWGDMLTVMAPSNNFHEMASITAGINDEIKAKFSTNYPGLPMVAATNRPDHGQHLRLLSDILLTKDVQENFYTNEAGGTSSAAPIVTGVVALMLSVKPDLSAQQVIEILKSTADKETVLDFTLDLADDPNLQGNFSGEFVDGKSRLFGAGKVNAFKAVDEAFRTVPKPSVIQPDVDSRP